MIFFSFGFYAPVAFLHFLSLYSDRTQIGLMLRIVSYCFSFDLYDYLVGHVIAKYC